MGNAAPRGPLAPARRARGYTYIVVLIWVAVTGIGAAAVGTLWQTAQRRDNERDLLQAGDDLRRAIGSYYAMRPPGQAIATQRLPQTLDELLRDPRHPGVVRHLRRIPVDPVTGTAEWGLLRAPDNGIKGVHSLSARKPMKQAGFGPLDESFAHAEHYADWKFEFVVPAQRSGPTGWK